MLEVCGNAVTCVPHCGGGPCSPCCVRQGTSFVSQYFSASVMCFATLALRCTLQHMAFTWGSKSGPQASMAWDLQTEPCVHIPVTSAECLQTLHFPTVIPMCHSLERLPGMHGGFG